MFCFFCFVFDDETEYGRTCFYANPTYILFMNKVKLFGLLASVSICAACNNDKSMPEPSFGSVPIKMSASVRSVLARAEVSNFPNASNAGTAQVSVLARKTSAADWTDLYIDNAIANVGSSSSSYSLAWAEGHEQFWPSNGDELTFVAYSPVSVGNGETTLNVALADEVNETVDVIVAHTKDGTNPITGMKSGSGQSPSSINFLFEHVMSQLVVKVNNMASDMTIGYVEVVVGKASCSKIYDIATREWSDGGAPAADKMYTNSKLMGGFGSDGPQEVFDSPILLLPGTESDVTVKLYKARGGSVFASKKIDEFKDSEGVFAKLVAGKRTTVTISISDGSLAGMTAGVQDWEELGEYETEI